MRVESLNIFRFIAAIIVINFHYTKLFPGFLTAGPEMVTFFFVLSGVVLVLVYSESENFSSKEFFLKRIKKLYPSYLIALTAVAAARFIAFHDVSNDDLLLSLLALQAWFPPHPSHLNLPAWAISVEAFFYLSFPMILYILKKRGERPYYIVLFAMFFWLMTQFIVTILLNSDFYKGFPSISHDFLFYFPLSHFCSFLLGVAIGNLAVKRDLELPKIIAYTCFIISAALIYSICEYRDMIFDLVGFSLPFGSSFLAPFFGFFILLIIINNNEYIFKLASNKFFIFLGAYSYEIYIFQIPMHCFIYDYCNINNNYIFLFLDILLSILIYILLKRALQELESKNAYFIPAHLLSQLRSIWPLLLASIQRIWSSRRDCR